MLTKNEITALSLSPTKKDFVQIWNELLEVAGKLSERWDPTSTNESDPGIVILKALTGIADKLNYNIDKNTLEAFMPTAAQEDSMRKLCDMLGYNIKYYRSAETNVTIKYHNTNPSEAEETALRNALLIPKFTVITNSDRDISYFTTNQSLAYISTTTPSVTLHCMEGQIVKCESTADNNVITAAQISENNRFYLPETQIAENGIFVYNVYSESTSLVDGTGWEKVDNLNIQARGSRVFKFGYDSYESRPYLEFPEDYSELINDGLFIYYARTSGANGNVSPRTLTQLEMPSDWKDVSAESFSVENTFAATTGSNIETIKQAYTNFKKTVGTFETLVTCRDYMNKIYTMVNDTGKPLVSNILVTDIRNDLNRAVTICSCDDSGIFYKEVPLVISTATVENTVESPLEEGELEVVEEKFVASDVNKPVYSTPPGHHQYGDILSGNGIIRYAYWKIGNTLPIFNDKYSRDFVSDTAFEDSLGGTVLAYNADGSRSNYWLIEQNGKTYTTKLPIDWVKSTTERQTNIVQTRTVTQQETKTDAISHFDLVFYPFKSYNQIKGNVKDVQEVYDSSFKYSSKSFTEVKNTLEEANIKTIAHNIVSPRPHDVVSINNYLKLSAIIGTNSKITNEEGSLLIETIKIALANAFNMRELDFGEEIPFDSIVEVIEKADSRIKVVSLNEPALYTTFSVYEGNDGYGNPLLKEYAVASDWLPESDADTFNTKEAKEIYNKLVVRNILAGRVPLFKYNNTFKTNFTEGAYRVTNNILEGIPAETKLPRPSAENPFTIYFENGKTYTGQWVALTSKPEKLQAPTATSGETIYTDEESKITYIGQWDEETQSPVYAKVVYTETAVPEQYIDNLITKNPTDDNDITEITTSCQIKAQDTETGKKISDVTLSTGEFIKFRAPNFITTKTYPAYVNYHLALNKELLAQARFAEATTLFALLNGEGTAETQKWNAVWNYFNGTDHKKKFTLTQKVSKVVTNGASNPVTKLEVENLTAGLTEGNPESILAKSGCVKLCNEGVPVLNWADTTATGTPAVELKNLTITMSNKTWFVTNPATFRNIQSAVDAYLATLPIDQLPEQAWTISYEFEYIPFEHSTLKEWENFIKYESTALFGFTPVEENGTVLWRTYGEGYQEGERVRSNGTKLIAFTSNYFSLLDGFDTRLHGIYITSDLGRNRQANFIGNNDEYMLRAGEYLFIEYTPSTTTEDGTAQTQESIKEVYSEGTIIRPNGFEEGLIDSSSQEKSPIKSVSFTSPTGVQFHNMTLFSLGANEQIEIRDFARVVLDKSSFTTSAAKSGTATNTTQSTTIFVYKNFNGCEALEGAAQFAEGKRINSSYTLKDGEYIFYTDKNKAELAYFTSGTEVTLLGRTVLPEFDTIDLATIFDVGLDEIPWHAVSFSGEDGITFQEYQYITLGPDDTLKNLTITDTQDCLNEQWQQCNDISYIPVGSKDPITPPKINTYDSDSAGSGWEASSILELNVSPSTAQTLRTTDKIKTSLTLNKPSANGGVGESILLEADEACPLSFKTNLACQSSNSRAKIDELYTNTNNLKSFELKVFSEEKPLVIKTEPGKIVPYHGTNTIDLTNWLDGAELTPKAYGELWNQVPLKTLASTADYDLALKLSASTLPNTYGIFSIYLNYGEVTSTVKTWIELIPGTSRKNITLLNVDEDELDWELSTDNTSTPDKLLLKPGLNCVRINTTCDIFIKTSSDAGTLYFDELRLVDAAPISYLENGQVKTQTTQGLNLAQLGYLAVSDNNTFNTLDMRTRKNLKANYTDTALTALDEKEQTANKDFAAAWKELLATKPKVQVLVDFLTKAIKEVDNLYKSGTSDTKYKDEQILQDLFANYQDIYNDLQKEITLKTALTNNTGIDELEQQLISLLGNFVSVEASQQALLEDLNKLRDSVITNTENLDSLVKEDILDDFTASANLASNSSLVSELKLASLDKINEQYSQQLDLIAENVNNVANSEDYDKLTAALEKLYTKKHTELLNQVQSLVTDSQTDLVNAINIAFDAATGELNKETTTYEVDYTAVAAQLRTVRDLVSGFDLNTLVSKIEFAANESLYTELAELVSDLSDLLKTSDNVLITSIDSLLTTVQNKISKNEIVQDENILKAIKDIQTAIYQTRDTQIENLLTTINTTIETLRESYSTIIENLRQSQDEQVTELSNQLAQIAKDRRDLAAKVSDFGKDSSFTLSDLPHSEEIILAIWPKYLKQALETGIDQLYKSIRSVIKNPTNLEIPNSLVIADSFYTNNQKTTLREVLVSLAKLSTFQNFYEQAKDLAYEYTQNSTREQVIEQLGLLVPFSSELSSAVKAIEESANANRNAIICNIINKLQTAPSVIEKQQLVKDLTRELDEVIQLDTTLVQISAKYLCPSILLFGETAETLPEAKTDEFYSALATSISEQKSSLLDSDNINNTLGTVLSTLTVAHQKVEMLLNLLDVNKVAEFKTQIMLLTDSTLQGALLAPTYRESLFDIQGLLIGLSQIAEIRECDIFKYLADDIVVAWETTTGNWIDSAGNAFKKYSNNAWVDTNGYWLREDDKQIKVNVKHSKDGNWIDCTTGAEIVIKVEGAWKNGSKTIDIQDPAIDTMLNQLLTDVSALLQVMTVSDASKDAYNTLRLEEQLLAEIRAIDENRSFYYNAPIESNVAIDFNEGDDKLNTLMNPAINYDINNINNNFVISKLDINYLTNGLQIARSSRLS